MTVLSNLGSYLVFKGSCKCQQGEFAILHSIALFCTVLCNNLYNLSGLNFFSFLLMHGQNLNL